MEQVILSSVCTSFSALFTYIFYNSRNSSKKKLEDFESRPIYSPESLIMKLKQERQKNPTFHKIETDKVFVEGYTYSEHPIKSYIPNKKLVYSLRHKYRINVRSAQVQGNVKLVTENQYLSKKEKANDFYLTSQNVEDLSSAQQKNVSKNCLVSGVNTS